MGESTAITTAGGVHGFPAVRTSFIGRAGPVRELAVLLEQCQLVTVTGPGGAGKTRYDVHAREQGIEYLTPAGARRREEALSVIWQALGLDRVRAAEKRGAAMSLDIAAEYALMLTAPAPPPAAAGAGLGGLSGARGHLTPGPQGVRAARRVQAAGGATGTTMTGRRPSAARRMREIAARLRARANLGQQDSSTAIARATGELAGLADKTAAQAAAVLRNGRRALPRALTGRMRSNSGTRPRCWTTMTASSWTTPSSTAAASAGSSSGASAAKAGSAASNAGTAGTAPAWTAGTEPRSGAGTGYSPTTW